MRLRDWRLLAAVLATAGCGAPTRPPVRLAVLPVETIGAPAADGPRLRQQVTAAAARLVPGGVVDAAEVDAVPGAASQPACANAPACPRLVGRVLGAPLVLTLTVATFARTHIVRARLIPISNAVAEREISETVVGDLPALEEVVRTLPGRFFPARQRWYQRFWVWAGAAALVGAVAAVAVVFGRDGGLRARDITFRIP